MSKGKGKVEGLKLSRLSPGDMDELMKIELDSFTLPWSQKSYEEILAYDSVESWVARVKDELVGYTLVQYVADEAELHTFAVKRKWRRQGIGLILIEHVTSEARAHGVKNVYLLVRTNNLPARFLYEKLGFKIVGLRRAYYADTNEDALVMRIEIT